MAFVFTYIALIFSGTIALASTAMLLAPQTTAIRTTLSGAKQLNQFNEVHLSNPGGIAVHEGSIYVANHDKNEVLVAKDTQNPTTMEQFAGVGWPSGVAVGSDGSVYVADPGDPSKGPPHNRVLKWTPGSQSATPMPEFKDQFKLNGPRGVAVDNVGNVYVADSGNHRVLELVKSSDTVQRLPFCDPDDPNNPSKGLSNPSAVAVDNVGVVYVTDSDVPRVYKLINNKRVPLFPYPPTRLNGPWGVAVDSSFNVYITDNDNVLKLAKDSPASPDYPVTGLEHASGVAVSSRGDVYVTDWGNGGRVLMMTALPGG